MKGQQANCLWCGQAYIKNAAHQKYCSTAHRVKGNRKKNGVAEYPSFIQSPKPAIKQMPVVVDQIPFPETPSIPVINPPSIRSNREAYRLITQNAATLAAGWYSHKLIDRKDDLWFGLAKVVGAMWISRVVAGKIYDAIKPPMPVVEQVLEIPVTKAPPTPSKRQKAGNGLVTAEQYRIQQIPVMDIDPNTVFGYMFGKPKHNFYLMLSGSPGKGKTTFAVKYADYVQKNIGDVIYLNSEQSGYDKNFQDLILKYDANFATHISPRDLSKKEMSALIGKHRMVVIDSVNHLGLTNQDVEQLRKENPNTAFTCIFQSLKDGNYKGDKSFEHDCDTYVRFTERGKANVVKSRSSNEGVVDVWFEPFK